MAGKRPVYRRIKHPSWWGLNPWKSPEAPKWLIHGVWHIWPAWARYPPSLPVLVPIWALAVLKWIRGKFRALMEYAIYGLVFAIVYRRGDIDLCDRVRMRVYEIIGQFSPYFFEQALRLSLEIEEAQENYSTYMRKTPGSTFRRDTYYIWLYDDDDTMGIHRVQCGNKGVKVIVNGTGVDHEAHDPYESWDLELDDLPPEIEEARIDAYEDGICDLSSYVGIWKEEVTCRIQYRFWVWKSVTRTHAHIVEECENEIFLHWQDLMHQFYDDEQELVKRINSGRYDPKEISCATS